MEAPPTCKDPDAILESIAATEAVMMNFATEVKATGDVMEVKVHIWH